MSYDSYLDRDDPYNAEEAQSDECSDSDANGTLAATPLLDTLDLGHGIGANDPAYTGSECHGCGAVDEDCSAWCPTRGSEPDSDESLGLDRGVRL